jgi:transposase
LSRAQRAIAKAIAKAIGAQRNKLEAAIAAKIDEHAPFAARQRIIQSVPRAAHKGLGPRFAAGAIAWLPELGHIGSKPAAALVGIAPYDEDSGAHHGERHIKGGRREIRNLLYMASLAATRCNPVIKAHYQQRRARGKKFKVALVACMRKLIAILNTMLARGQMWNPPAGAVAVACASATWRGRRSASIAWRPTSPVSRRGQGRSRRRRGRAAPALSPADHRATSHQHSCSPLPEGSLHKNSSFRGAAKRRTRNPYSRGLWLWIPGSRPSAAPRNDRAYFGRSPQRERGIRYAFSGAFASSGVSPGWNSSDTPFMQ